MSAPVNSPIRVLILDDHPIVRIGLCMLINSHPGFTVAGETGDAHEAVAIVTRLQPDIIILDLDLGHSSGVDALPQLQASAPNARILVLTGVRDPEMHARAVQLGARGVVLKQQANEAIIEAITKAHAGEIWLDPDTMAQRPSHQHHTRAGPQPRGKASLTKREREIVALVCQGYKNQEVASHLSISEGTVRNHLTLIYEKLGVSDRFGLIIYVNQGNLN